MDVRELIFHFGLLSARQKKLVLSRVTDPDEIPEHAFEADYFGLRYRGHTASLIDKHIFYLGSYEAAVLKIIQEELQKSRRKVFLDVGANVGVHSLFASKYASRIFAFEPYPVVRKQFSENIQLNGLQNITLLPYGLGDQNEIRPFFEPGRENLGTGSFVKEFSEKNFDTGASYQLFRGDDVLSDLVPGQVDVLKIDTEGFEAQVLSGMPRFLREQRPLIILEFSILSARTLNERPEIFDFLKSHYHLQMLMAPNDPESEIFDWTPDHNGTMVCRPK